MVIRALFSVNSDVMERFRACVPNRERSRMVEFYMRKEIEKRERSRESRIERLALMVENDPDFAEVRAVSDDVNAVAGEMIA